MITPFDIEKKLKKMRPKPLRADEKERLWSNIYLAMSEEKKLAAGTKGFSVFGFLDRRFAYGALLVIFLVGSTGATIAAADSAKPGDALFPLDIASEKIQIAISFGDKKNELRIKFAQERLDEAKEVVAAFFASIEASGEGNTGGATTTDDVLITATSTDDEEISEEVDLADIEGVNSALVFAIEELEKTRSTLEAEGNFAAVLALEGIIGELTQLAENHISELDKFEIKIKNTGKKLTLEIKVSSEELKTKLKFEERFGGRGGGRNEVKIKMEDSKSEIKIKSGSIKIEFKQESEKKEHDDDEDDDDKHKKEAKKHESKKVKICHIPPGNHKKAKTIEVSKRSLEAHLDHGDVLGECDDDDNNDNDTATSTPDIIAPLISNIHSTTTINTAEILWDTDEESDSVAWYATTTPLAVVSGISSVDSADMVVSHSLSLAELEASMTYYFIVTSTDDAGNTATSSELSFTTLAEEVMQEPEDTTPPVLSDITATSTVSTLTISWDTDEDSTGTAWYGLSTPLSVSSTTPFMSHSDFVSVHNLVIMGLTASSTYYYIVSSADESGNTATSTEFSVLVLPE